MIELELMGKGVKSIFIFNANHYYVEEVKEKCPELKIDVNKIVYIDEIPFIKSEDIYKMTPFDHMMKKTLFYKKPKK